MAITIKGMSGMCASCNQAFSCGWNQYAKACPRLRRVVAAGLR